MAISKIGIILHSVLSSHKFKKVQQKAPIAGLFTVRNYPQFCSVIDSVFRDKINEYS